jgi:hypothetical protein
MTSSKPISPLTSGCKKDFNSRWDFEEKLKNLGHYPTHYKNIEDLKLRFQQQLNTLIEAGQI